MKNANLPGPANRVCREWQEYLDHHKGTPPDGDDFLFVLVNNALLEQRRELTATPPSPSVGAEDVAKRIGALIRVTVLTTNPVSYRYDLDIPEAAALITAHTDAKVAEAVKGYEEDFLVLRNERDNAQDEGAAANKRADELAEALKVYAYSPIVQVFTKEDGCPIIITDRGDVARAVLATHGKGKGAE